MLESEKIKQIIERKWEREFPVKRHNKDLVFFTISPLIDTYETIVLPINKINQEIADKMMDYNEFDLIPISLQSTYSWTKNIMLNNSNIQFLPEKFQSYELYEMVVINNPNLIKFVKNAGWFKKLINLIENNDKFDWNIPLAMQPLLSDYHFILFLYNTSKESLIYKKRIDKNILDNLFIQMDLIKIKRNLYHVYMKVSKDVWNENLYIKASINAPAFYKKIPNTIRKNIEFIEQLITEDKTGVLTSYMSVNSLPEKVIQKIIDRNIWDVEFVHKSKIIKKLNIIEKEPRIILQIRPELITDALIEKSLDFFLSKNLIIEDNPVNEKYIKYIIYEYYNVNPEQLAKLYYKSESESLKKCIKRHLDFPSELDMSIQILDGSY